jgi:phenylalanyl-tRNA synthetase beta subunit
VEAAYPEAEAARRLREQGSVKLPDQSAAPESLLAWVEQKVSAKHPLWVQARAMALEQARTLRKVGKGRTIGSWTKFEAIKVSSP